MRIILFAAIFLLPISAVAAASYHSLRKRIDSLSKRRGL
jgi:hypothetical protein